MRENFGRAASRLAGTLALQYRLGMLPNEPITPFFRATVCLFPRRPVELRRNWDGDNG